jgi:hypothetical protein
MILVFTVREVESGHVHARQQQLTKHFRGITGGANRRYNFGVMN